MTLGLARAVKLAIDIASFNVNVMLTRDSDVNFSLKERAAVAKNNAAEVFLSIHFNGFDGKARGTETWIQSVANGNLNYTQDKGFADRVRSGVFGAIARYDPKARDRGIKEDKVLSVITDDYLGNSTGSPACRACLLEVEFIDVPAVDALLNTGSNAGAVQAAMAESLKTAILGELQATAPLQMRSSKRRARSGGIRKKRTYNVKRK